MFDDEKSGRPCEIGDEKREDCAKIVKGERQLTIKNLSERLQVSVRSVHTILHGLEIRKLASRFVQKFLTSEMCENRLQCCHPENILIFDEYGDNFLKNIITVDETPLSLSLSTSQNQSESRLSGNFLAKAVPRRCDLALQTEIH